MSLRYPLFAVVALALTGCGQPATQAPAAPSAPAAPASPQAPLPPVEPPAPGTPGGLPDDRTPISEAPFTPQSAQGAANVVQTYYALIGEKKYADAWALRGPGPGQPTADDFVRSFGKYESYNAQVGGPGPMEGAAGSSYVSVPVVIYGRLKTGAEVHEKGEAQLRRVNDVPGATAEQLTWRIVKIETRPTN